MCTSELQKKLETATFVISADMNAKVDVGLAIGAETSGKADAISAVVVQNNTMLTQLIKSKNESKKETDPLSFIRYPVHDSVVQIQKISKTSTKGTRVWLLDEIEEKFSSIEVYCLRGEAGMGKSVISACLGKRLQDSKLLKAAFFCKNGDDKTNNFVALIQNVAHQLANSNSEFYNALIEAHRAFYQQFKRDPSTVVELLDTYIVIPLSKWPENVPCFVILDALDELLTNSSLIKDLGTLLTEFSASGKVKLFVTTRTTKADMEQILPDCLMAIIRDFPHENDDKQHNLEDIELFATTQLKPYLIKRNFTDGDIAILANFFKEKSNGLFIWAAMALNIFSLTKTYKNIPWIESNSTQMMELLKIELQEIAKLKLYDFYTLAFERAYPPSEDKKYFQAAIGFVLHAKVPVSLRLIARLVAEFDGLPNSENPSLEEIFAVRDYVERSSSLLYNDDPDDLLDGKLHFIHKTVREYLSDEKTLFSIDGQSMSVQIAKTYLKRFCGGKFLFKNMANLSATASEFYSGNTLSEELVYGVQFWHLHFIEALSSDCAIDDKKELICLFVKFCETKLVYYLEALILLNKLNDIPRLVADLTACLREVRFESLLDNSPLAWHEILSLLNDLKCVVINFRTQLLVSPLQVYNHALIGVPQKSVYYQLYQGLASARLTIGAEKDWGPFTLLGHSRGVKSVAFSTDSKTIVSGSSDKTVKLWSVETGQLSDTFVGHSESVTSVAFSPDSEIVVSGSRDGTVRLWDVKTGQYLKTFEGHDSTVEAVAFSPDTMTVVSGSYDTTVKLWDLKTGKLVNTFKGHSECVNAVAFSLDCNTVVSGSFDRTVKLWSVETGECVTLEGHSGGVSSAAFSLDGKTVVSGSDDRTVKLWDVKTGKLSKTFEDHSRGVTSVAFSPDGKTVVSGSDDRTVKLWNVKTGKLFKTLLGHSRSVTSVAYVADSKAVVSGSYDNTVKLWDVETGECWKTFIGNFYFVNSVAFSSDSKCAIFGSDDRTVKLWDVETGECLATLEGHSSGVTSVAFSPDSMTVVSGSYDMTVKLWDVMTGKLINTFKGHSECVNAVAVSPDCNTVVSGSFDRTVKLWSVETGECVTLEGHSDGVSSVAFSLDGKTVVSGSDDRTVKLWDVKTGKLSKTLVGHSRGVTSVAFAPDSTTVVSQSLDMTVTLWAVKTGQFLERRNWDGSNSTQVFFPSKLTVQDGWVCQGKTLLYCLSTEIDGFSNSSVIWTAGKKLFSLTLNK
ncbi:WD40 repeat-like protein [Rhizoclosmatium globosum]|uniref:WD40 repeat-like protein n=1 Tax=Rhizoclosmatium globosum TaxID=329046 RepID=A0A1Y2CZ03_9FUNG|nr:WD40 repeat-like protein [Rhizoclosmatium globosum]|eukprot:ORY52272.1 WD40 repeat-like protein [Rhizoclosmatium globosum]